MRMIGHVTPVPIRRRSVACAMPPRTDHTNGLSPCASIHGWKWSLTHAVVNPTSSARAAARTISLGPSSSLENATPSSMIASLTVGRVFPRAHPGKRPMVSSRRGCGSVALLLRRRDLRVDEQAVGPDLVLTTDRDGNRAVLTVRGELDAYSTPGLEDQSTRLGA